MPERFERLVIHAGLSAIAVVGVLGIVAGFSLTIGSLIEVVLRSVGVAAGVVDYTTLFLFATGLLFSLLTFFPFLSQPLGVCVRSTSSLRLRRWARMRSIKHQLAWLRKFLVISGTLPVITLVVSAWAHYGNTIPVSGSSRDWLFVVVLFFLAAGVAIRAGGNSLYRAGNRARLKRSLRYHHRGVLLRSFIPQWDSTSRRIYSACSLSRKISLMHRSCFIAAASAFTAAGCLAATLSNADWSGELLTLISMVGLLTMWPTVKRLVRTASDIIDPLTGEEVEYEFYD